MLSYKFNKNNEKIILVIAAYGIVQVLAQDLGIKSGKKQVKLIQSLPIQIILLFAGSYIVTSNINLSLITIGLYYSLKYIYSKGETFLEYFENI